jgi:hypothetical protein
VGSAGERLTVVYTPNTETTGENMRFVDHAVRAHRFQRPPFDASRVGEALDDGRRAELVHVCSDTPMTRTVARNAEIWTLIVDGVHCPRDLVADGDSDAHRADAIRRREARIDQVLEDSFPASDPPPWTCIPT